MNPTDNKTKDLEAAGDVLTMSDEDFLNLDPSRYDSLPGPGSDSGSKGKDNQDDEDDLEEEEEDDGTGEAGREQVHAPDESGDDESDLEDGQRQPESRTAELEAGRGDDEPGQGLSPDKSTPDGGGVDETSTSGVDYKQFYEKVMAPFKANGRMIEIRSPEEAITLMQKGANYVRTMQRLKPYKKVLAMLEKNELLDEEKIGYLIDLEKKDVGAIRKLVKDSGIDPLDDGDAEQPYRPGLHQVSDEEAAFRETLDQLTDSDGGPDTITVINQTWDPESKRILWKNPEIMSIIHVHRQNGVYDKIAAEVERRRTLGVIPESMSFLQAYQELGNQMYPAPGAQTDQTNGSKPNGQDPKKPRVVDTGIAPSHQKKMDNDLDTGRRARGTSSSRPSRGNKEEFVNPLEMSDEEFLKQMEGRL